MTRYVFASFLFWFITIASHLLFAQQNCKALIEDAKRLYNQGFYPESLKLLYQIEDGVKDKKKSECISRDFYELKTKLFIAMNERDGVIDSLMRNMIKADPTYNAVTPASYSQAFCNRFYAFNVYPDIQVGFGTTISGISISSRGELSQVFYSTKVGDVSSVAPDFFTTVGLTVFSTMYFHKYVAGKVECTQNFPATSKLAYDLDAENTVSVMEDISSRLYSVSFINKLGFLKKGKIKFLKNAGIEVGYQLFTLNRSNSKYEFFTKNMEQEASIKYTHELDTKPFRENLVHNLLFGISYEPQQFINNKRIKLNVGVRYVVGLSDYNRIETRFDNQISTQLYYYAEDRFRMKSIQLQLQLAYNVHYHKNKHR